MFTQTATQTPQLAGIFDFVSSRKDCLKPSEPTVETVFRVANYNAGADTKDGDTPEYSYSDVKAVVYAFYSVRCDGWGFAPHTADELKVVQEVSKRSKVNPDLCRVVLYELYYAMQRNEIYDYPPPGKVNETSSTGASKNLTTTTDTKPGQDTDYKAPREGGGAFIDQVKAGFKKPLVWGTAIVVVGGYLAYKFIPSKKSSLSDKRRVSAKRKHKQLMDKYERSLRV